MRLNPACSSPTSLPSVTATRGTSPPRPDRRHRVPHPLDRLGDRARGQHHPGEAGEQRRRAEEDDRRREAVGRGRADPGGLGEPDEAEAEDRRARPQRPGQQDPRRDAGQRRLVGHAVGERQLGHRAGDALGEQVGERARDRAAEHRGDADRGRQPAAVLQVERDEARAGGGPQRGLDEQQPQRHPQRRELLAGIRRPALAQPARAGQDVAGAPGERERDRDRQAGGERGGVRDPRAALVGDVGQRQHPRQEREDDDRADDVRAQDRRGQRQHDALRDRSARRPGHAADRTRPCRRARSAVVTRARAR